MLAMRADEPAYAKLYDPSAQTSNRYGNRIKLTEVDDNGVSLRINGDDGIGCNPNRTLQHAFYFEADNCIGCHACEAACSEKNDLPAHVSFRSVGYVEGGTYPDVMRMNISMACNHCDDPVCLKGCPTRAYTKHPEYGAVIQDPDICFGCGYCTWVCPYNAPQLDPIAGQVEKCNMCVDRLEIGLKPACVSACVGNALDFGVVENTPNGRWQSEASIPGFPDPSITQPNIRFQQTKRTPRELTRTDSAPVKYLKDTTDGRYKRAVDAKVGHSRHWNIARLSSRENPLVIFTLATQVAIGAFIVALVADFARPSMAYSGFLLVMLALVGLGLVMSTMHLGKPKRFYRGFNNLRHSPVSREGLATVGFGGFVVLHGAAMWIPAFASFASLMGVFAAAAGLATLLFMVQCYRIRARPFWDHWQTPAAFFGTALGLGGFLAMAYAMFTESEVPGVVWFAIPLGLAIEAVGVVFHARDLNEAEHEGAASHYVQRTTFGHTYRTRNVLLGLSALATAAMAVAGIVHPMLWAAFGVVSVAIAVIGRALFYVLVIPTTMPGAFFWKNKAFEEHARDIGLAANPSVGVAPLHH